MNQHDIASAAQDIIKQAQIGPGDKPGQIVRNNLSPHLERFAYERMRKLIITTAHDLEAEIVAELHLCRAAIDPVQTEAHQALETAIARVRERIKNTFAVKE